MYIYRRKELNWLKIAFKTVWLLCGANTEMRFCSITIGHRVKLYEDWIKGGLTDAQIQVE